MFHSIITETTHVRCANGLQQRRDLDRMGLSFIPHCHLRTTLSAVCIAYLVLHVLYERFANALLLMLWHGSDHLQVVSSQLHARSMRPLHKFIILAEELRRNRSQGTV